MDNLFDEKFINLKLLLKPSEARRSLTLTNKGFTLIELLITISIMTVLLVVAIPSYSKYGKYNELTQVAQTIKSGILTAKNYTLAPPVTKTQGAESYKIVFGSNPANYKIIEDGTGASTTPLDSATFKDYTLSFDPAGISNIVFSIADKGKIVSPTIPSGIITLTSNKISGSDNQIKIKIYTLTGQVEIIQ